MELEERLLGDMILAEDKALAVLQLLVEGCSLRTTSRITGVHLKTILNLLGLAGERCEKLLNDRIHGVPVSDVQCDEIWGFVGMKEKTKKRAGKADDETLGDVWTYVAFERNHKLMLAWHVGRRTYGDTVQFTEKLAYATEGHHNFQITTDGFAPYRDAVVLSLGAQLVHFAQLVKIYATPQENQTRYSPAECTGTKKVKIYGNPDSAKVCTSHVERQNLNIRMAIRRMTRLTNGFSKKWSKHYAMMALYIAYYNFCRVHSSIRCTPAMEAGITDHIWTIRELLSV